MGIYLRGKVYYGEFEFKGQRYKQSLETSSKREAQRLFETWLKEVKTSVLPSANRECIRLKEAAERMFNEVWKACDNGEEQKKRVEYIAELVGNLRLDEIDNNVVLNIRAHLDNGKRKPSTLNRYMTNLGTVLNRANQIWKVIPNVPVIEKLQENNERSTRLTDTDLGVICTWLHKRGEVHTEKALLTVFLADTTLRIREALNMRWTWLHREADGQLWVKIPGTHRKNNKPLDVPLTPRAEAIIEARRQACKPTDAKVWSTTYDAMRKQWDIMRKDQAVQKQISVPLDEMNRHCLRHTGCSNLAAAGVPLEIIAMIAGHSNMTVTKRYTHWAPKASKDAIGALAANQDQLANRKLLGGLGITDTSIDQSNLIPQEGA